MIRNRRTGIHLGFGALNNVHIVDSATFFGEQIQPNFGACEEQQELRSSYSICTNDSLKSLPTCPIGELSRTTDCSGKSFGMPAG